MISQLWYFYFHNLSHIRDLSARGCLCKVVSCLLYGNFWRLFPMKCQQGQVTMFKFNISFMHFTHKYLVVQIRSMAWLMMPWWLKSPEHQQPWHWPGNMAWPFSAVCEFLQWGKLMLTRSPMQVHFELGSIKLAWASEILYGTYKGHLFSGECSPNLLSYIAC